VAFYREHLTALCNEVGRVVPEYCTSSQYRPENTLLSWEDVNIDEFLSCTGKRSLLNNSIKDIKDDLSGTSLAKENKENVFEFKSSSASLKDENKGNQTLVEKMLRICKEAKS